MTDLEIDNIVSVFGYHVYHKVGTTESFFIVANMIVITGNRECINPGEYFNILRRINEGVYFELFT